jgi:hypothetical protein
MKTGGATSLSSRGCGKRPLGYVPGSKVMEASKRRRRPCKIPELPAEVIDKILAHLVERRAGGSVVILSMVNRAFHEHISKDAQLWYKLYLHWRGPVQRPSPELQRPYGVANAARMVPLLPSTPRTVPNFRTKTRSMRYAPAFPRPWDRQTTE